MRVKDLEEKDEWSVGECGMVKGKVGNKKHRQKGRVNPTVANWMVTAPYGNFSLGLAKTTSEFRGNDVVQLILRYV